MKFVEHTFRKGEKRTHQSVIISVNVILLLILAVKSPVLQRPPPPSSSNTPARRQTAPSFPRPSPQKADSLCNPVQRSSSSQTSSSFSASSQLNTVGGVEASDGIQRSRTSPRVSSWGKKPLPRPGGTTSSPAGRAFKIGLSLSSMNLSRLFV